MEDLWSIIALLCLINVSAISSIMFPKRNYIRNSLTLLPTYKYRSLDNKFKQFMTFKKCPRDVAMNAHLEFMVYQIVHRYLANIKNDYRTEPENSNMEVKKCENECKKEVRIVCAIDTYTCTDYTIDHLSHSCYLECHWHLTDPNPYREHLYQEKFRKGRKKTTTTELAHPSTRVTTEAYSSEYYGFEI